MSDLSRRAAIAGLLATAAAGAAPARPTGREQDRHLDRALSGRRRLGHLRAARRRRHGRPARPADGDRQQERRRRHRRHRRGGARAGRRLHVAAGRHRPHLCADDLSQCRLRFRCATSRRSARSPACPTCWWSTRPGSMSRRWPSFIAAAKKQPGAIDIGSAGARHRDAPRHRPVRSARRACSSTMCPIAAARPCCRTCWPGRSSAAFVVLSALVPHVQSGKLRALAIAGRRREPSLPDVPTMARGRACRTSAPPSGSACLRPGDARCRPRSHPWRRCRPRSADREGQAAVGGAGRTVELESRADFARFVAARHRALEPHRPRRQHPDGVTDDHHSSGRAGRPADSLSASPGSARAADFPSRPMNWIVPFPPGGSNDIFARPIAAFVGQRLRQPVVVENRGGAGGTIGGMIAARSQARRLHLAGGQSQPDLRPDRLCRIGLRPDARLRGRVGHRPGAGGAGRQSRQGRRQGSRGLPGDGAQGAGRDQHRLVGPRHHPASRHRAPAAADRHPADARAVSRRRAGAAGPDGGPDRRHLRAAQHRGVLCAVRPPARAGRRGDPSASPCCPTCRPSRRPASPISPSAPGTACSRPRRRRLRSSTRCMPPSRRRWPIRTSKRIWAEQGAEPDLQSRQAFTEFVGREVERWSRIARTVGLPME